jgi:3-hydroxybutyryl-CoA dehydrogenase
MNSVAQPSGKQNLDDVKIVALGAGRMGRGIAIAFAYAGHSVTLLDFKSRDPQQWAQLSNEAHADMRTSLLMLAELGAMPEHAVAVVMARISIVAYRQAAQVLKCADLVFEGVPETLDAKRDTFARLCPLIGEHTIIASTTSTILVTDLVPMVTHPERLINAHWLNPAYVIPLVELSKHAGTSTTVIEKLKNLLEAIGKVAVLCGPAPGYIVPRLQALVMNEAARMVEEGVASAEDIDKATRYGMGLRFAALGVVEFIDYGGNDILFHASRYLSQAISAERYTAPEIVQRHMREGKNGLKDGQGFYDYRNRDIAAYRRDVLSRTLDMLKQTGMQRPPKL